MKKDNQGRITNLVNAQHVSKGHSVCISCEKDMPICWDTVCTVCGDTSCYDCSYSDGKFWYCKKHAPEKPKCYNNHCDDYKPESKNGCRYSDDPQNCMAYLPKLKGETNETKGEKKDQSNVTAPIK